MLSTADLMGFIPVTDAARAQRFYCDVLGLALDHDNGFAIILRAPHRA